MSAPPATDGALFSSPVFAEPCAVKYIQLVVTTRHVGLKILEIPSCPLGNLIVSGFKQDPSQPPQVKTPAETAGVQVGDVLVSISDTLVAYMTYDDMAEVLGKAQRPAKFVFARHTMPFNPESARPENIILKQATMLKKGKHFFNVIEHERNFLATLKYLTFVGSKTHAKEVLVSTMTALRHDDERIYVETTSRNYKFRCKSSADKSEWLYSFLCALYLQGNVTSYVNAINMINNPALLTADADGLPATPAAAGGAAAPGASGAAATDHRAYELTAVPEESVLSAPAPPVSTTAPSAASSDSEEESDSDDDAPADATPPTKAIPVPVAKPTGPPPPARTPQGISVPISARMAPPQVAAAQKKVVIHVPPPTSPPGRPAPRPAAVVVEAANRPNLAKLFNSIDSNSDGYVSSPEFIASANATRFASLPGGLRSALDRFATIDTKGLGVVSRDDFLDAFEGFTDANFLAWLTAATRAVAAEPPRKVSISSPAAAPVVPAPAVIDEDVKAQVEYMFRIVDTNDDGIISLREFQAVLRKGSDSSALTTNLKAQLALIKLIEDPVRKGEIHLDKFIEVLSGPQGAEFQHWLENAPAVALS